MTKQSDIPATIDGDRFYSAGEVAARYGFALQSLANMRHKGRGPKFVKIGKGRSGAIRYRASDLAEWEKTFCGPAAQAAA